MKITLMLLALIAMLVRAEHAHACSCSAPRITVSPDGTDAPINATVVVWVPSYVVKGTDVSLSLRMKTTGDTVAVDFRTVGAASVTVVELMPRVKLAVKTEYEIVQGAAVVGAFTTGTRQLSAVPVWGGIGKSGFYKDTAVCCICNTSNPYARLALAEKLDDRKPYRVAIWMAGSDGKIDYKKPPVTYEQTADTLWLGHPSTCSPANFLFPKQQSLKLGVKLVDLAGNASTASEITLDLTKPERPPDN